MGEGGDEGVVELVEGEVGIGVDCVGQAAVELK